MYGSSSDSPWQFLFLCGPTLWSSLKSWVSLEEQVLCTRRNIRQHHHRPHRPLGVILAWIWGLPSLQLIPSPTQMPSTCFQIKQFFILHQTSFHPRSKNTTQSINKGFTWRTRAYTVWGWRGGLGRLLQLVLNFRLPNFRSARQGRGGKTRNWL